MSELRTDPLTGRSVVVARHRASRPNEFRARQAADQDQPPAYQPDCPFCQGNEGSTPPPLYEVADHHGQWTCRVVPNKYPVCVSPEQAHTSDEFSGTHEVIIESREHLIVTSQLGAGGLAEVLGVYAARLNHWRDDARFPFRLLFKNVGPSAGASLSHLHSQFMALPHISTQMAVEMANVRATEQPEKAWRRWIEDELSDGSRWVAQSDHFVLFCPRVGRGPLETWVMPREQSPWFEESLNDELRCAELAQLMLPVVQRLEGLIAPSGYNIILSTSPVADEYASVGWWRLEIVPRMASLAGFELGTGMFINTVAPGEAAAAIRG